MVLLYRNYKKTENGSVFDEYIRLAHYIFGQSKTESRALDKRIKNGSVSGELKAKI